MAPPHPPSLGVCYYIIIQSMDFKQLLNNYRNGTMNEEQRAAFEQLLHDQGSEQQLQQLLNDSLENIEPVAADETQEYLYERIKTQYIGEEVPGKQAPRIHLLKPVWLRYAAAVIIIFGVAAYFLLNNPKHGPVVTNTSKQVQHDMAPGHDGAVLTLANGRRMVLDSLGNGVIAKQNGAQVILQNGSLAYHLNGQTANAVEYNTMHTPRGRQFQLTLPDGTKVWLNAASSIKYPTVFTGNARTVEINGEVYFEVVKNAAMPFIVKINEATKVEVLGTHFNINAYNDEPAIKTTLLEGSVKVTKDAASAILKPGEQISISHSSQKSHIIPVLTDEVMAWKNGLFNFNGYDIKAVMREIGRWYDLDIVYEGEPEPEEVMGELQRSLSLSQVMKILQKIHVKYRIEGRKLIVMK